MLVKLVKRCRQLHKQLNRRYWYSYILKRRYQVFIAKVVGNVVSTQKAASLIGYKLLIIATLKKSGVFDDTINVAVDTIGAGIGEWVLVVSGSGARYSLENGRVPVNHAIVGIIDYIDMSDSELRDDLKRQ